MTTETVIKKKYLLIDLDGTLTDTADIALKAMKDGIIETDLSQIKVFEGAIDFLGESQKLGFECFVLSDSHPKYVNPIVQNFFGGLASLSLADKPNTLKSLNFLQQQNIDLSNSFCYVIGDSWLDIELGRGLQVPTILTGFYEAKNLEIRDGIGNYLMNIKSGSTYYAKSYEDILGILRNPLENLLCLEAKFRNVNSHIARNTRLSYDPPQQGKLIAHRILARQVQGECDQYHATEKYFEFSRTDRSQELLETIRDAVLAYIDKVLSYQVYSWNILTYVPDKRTTTPAEKMAQLFRLISEQVENSYPSILCQNIFEWDDNVTSSIRKQPTAIERRKFVCDYINLCNDVNVNDKSIIIIDDQYTTGATADILVEKLKSRGANNILFIALFGLATSVSSNRLCPQCSQPLQLKINQNTGEKFYSCVLPKYKGKGCGYNDSGKLCPECLKNNQNKFMKARTNNQTNKRFLSCTSPQYGGNGCGYTEAIE